MAVFDVKLLKALGSPTRLRIIRRLKGMHMTLSDLSASFGMHPSTIKGHLDLLAAAGLVRMEDEGRKWKYYELTPAGIEVSSGTELRIALPALAGFAFLFLSARAPQPAGELMGAVEASKQQMVSSAASSDIPPAVASKVVEQTPFQTDILLAIVGLALISCSILLWFRSRKPSPA